MIELIGQSINTKSEWHMYGAINNFSDYKDFIKALKEAQLGDSIELKINSPGGYCDIGMMIIQAIRSTQAVVVCNVVYPSHSMGALIAIAGDYMIMQPNSFLMFHTYSGSTGGKSGDMILDVENTDEALKGMIDAILYPFLSKAEIKKMHKGQDLYIKADSPDLHTRVQRHFKGIEIS